MDIHPKPSQSQTGHHRQSRWASIPRLAWPGIASSRLYTTLSQSGPFPLAHPVCLPSPPSLYVRLPYVSSISRDVLCAHLSREIATESSYNWASLSFPPLPSALDTGSRDFRAVSPSRQDSPSEGALNLPPRSGRTSLPAPKWLANETWSLVVPTTTSPKTPDVSTAQRCSDHKCTSRL